MSNVAGIRNGLSSSEGSVVLDSPVPGHRSQSIDSIDRPLSLSQEHLWLLTQLHPEKPLYNLAVAYRLTGVLDVPVLEQSIGCVAQRHDVLRTTFPAAQGRPVQRVFSSVSFALPVLDLERVSTQERWASAMELAREEAKRPFDLGEELAWRSRLYRLSEEEHVLLLVFHHIISDSHSVYVFCRELESAYSVHCNDRAMLPPAHSLTQFADFALRQNDRFSGHLLDERLAFWVKRLGDAATLKLPTDHPALAVPSYRGACRYLSIPPDVTRALGELREREKASLFVTLLAGFQVLLHKLTLQRTLVICSIVSGRHHANTRHAMGYFNNILPLSFDLDGNPTFVDLLRRTRGVVLDAYKHQETPFSVIVNSPKLMHISFSRVLFSLETQWPPELRLPCLASESHVVHTETADFDLSVAICAKGEHLEGWFKYKTDLFAEGTISGMTAQYESLLGELVENPHRPISEYLVRDQHLARRGLAIEALAAERALATHPAVAEAAVLRCERGPGIERLVAYVVAAPGTTLDPEALQNQIVRRIPTCIVPVSFVVLEALPLTAEGEVDRNALPPAPDRDPQGYRAPRTLDEEILCGLFSDLLCRESVGIDDDFFELGGHSVLVLRLSDEIARIFKQNHPLNLVYRHPTVAQLAAVLVSGASAAQTQTRSLFGLCTDDRRAPFFCLSEAPLLASQLEGIPVHSLGCYFDDLRAHNSIEEIARVNVERIRKLQEEGPYQLSGFCGMALVAIEVARKLLRQGQEVSRLILIEPPAVAPTHRTRSYSRYYAGRILYHLARLAHVHPGHWPRYCLRRACTIKRRIASWTMEMMNQPDKVDVLYRMEKAIMAYTPEIYPGRVVLFVASERVQEFEGEKVFGWDTVAAGGLEVRIIPGDHNTFAVGPNLRFLAQELRDVLECTGQGQR